MPAGTAMTGLPEGCARGKEYGDVPGRVRSCFAWGSRSRDYTHSGADAEPQRVRHRLDGRGESARRLGAERISQLAGRGCARGEAMGEGDGVLTVIPGAASY